MNFHFGLVLNLFMVVSINKSNPFNKIIFLGPTVPFLIHMTSLILLDFREENYTFWNSVMETQV